MGRISAYRSAGQSFKQPAATEQNGYSRFSLSTAPCLSTNSVEVKVIEARLSAVVSRVIIATAGMRLRGARPG